MPDIELRFGRDMLVLSAPVDATLARQGIDAALDRQYLNLMEGFEIESSIREVAASAETREKPEKSEKRLALWQKRDYNRYIPTIRRTMP